MTATPTNVLEMMRQFRCDPESSEVDEADSGLDQMSLGCSLDSQAKQTQTQTQMQTQTQTQTETEAEAETVASLEQSGCSDCVSLAEEADTDGSKPSTPSKQVPSCSPGQENKHAKMFKMVK